MPESIILPTIYVNMNIYTDVLLSYLFIQKGYQITNNKPNNYLNDIKKLNEQLPSLFKDITDDLISFTSLFKDINEDINEVDDFIKNIKFIIKNKDEYNFLIGYDYYNDSVDNIDVFIKSSNDYKAQYMINNMISYIKTGELILTEFTKLIKDIDINKSDKYIYYDINFINQIIVNKKDKQYIYFNSLFDNNKGENIVALLVAYTNNLNLNTKFIAVHQINNDPNQIKVSLRPYKNNDLNIRELEILCDKGGDNKKADADVELFNKFDISIKSNKLYNSL